jgi:MFS family permease
MQLLNKLRNKTGLQGHQPGIWVAMGIQAIRSTGFSISFTYLPLYLYQQRHISMTLVGSIILISGIISGFSQIVGGMLADRFGHRKIFIIFQLTETLLFALLAVLIGTNGVVWSIFLTSVMVTIMGGMSAPAISAIVADVSQKNRLTESYGLMAIGGNLGWAIGPLTGGYLQSLTSYAWVFGIGALITSLSLIGTPYLPREDTIGKPTELLSKKNLKIFLSDSTLIIFCVLCMLFYLEIAQWGSTLSVFTVDRIGFSPEQYGLLMSISGVLIIIFQYPISQRIEWLGSRRALSLGSFLYGAGFLSLGWVKSFIPAIGSIIILVTGEMLFVPTSYAVIGKISRLEDRAKNMGLLGLCGTIGGSFGPLLGGFLLDKFPTRPLYLWGPIALPAFLAAVSFMLWRGYARTEVTSELIADNQIGNRR